MKTLREGKGREGREGRKEGRKDELQFRQIWEPYINTQLAGKKYISWEKDSVSGQQ